MDLATVVQEVQRRQLEGGVFNRYFHTPKERLKYPHWMEFFKVGSRYHERLALCGNQVGKTTAGLTEITYHVTGLYPDWWEGHRYPEAQTWWVCGTTQKDTKDVLQERLLGPVGSFGTGFIPKDLLDFESLRDAKKAETSISTFRVKHVTGSMSTITFKSYEQGREAYQGKPGISVLLDEEPPFPVYTEALMRTIAGDNRAILTFTPLQGISEVVLNFLGDEDIYTAAGEMAPSRYVVRTTQYDAPHLTKDKLAALLLTIPLHQRDARTRGIPSLGSGAIYPLPEESYIIEPFELPEHWPRCYGFDVGRNTAAVWLAHDREANSYYAYADAFQVEGTPASFASIIRAKGKWLRGAIDTSARQRAQTDGQNLFKLYTDEELHVVNADKAVEAGIFNVLQLLTQGRLKIFRTCQTLRNELRMYRRDEKGLIVKKNDHACDALRYAVHTAPKVLWTEAEANAVLHPAPWVPPPRPYVADAWMLA